MVRLIAGRELSWVSLSGGEQAWVRIIAHLLIVGSSTTLPFVFFDEPLEHLDPRLRATAAAMLAGATQNGGPRQLIVTTYEDALAEQLAEGRRDGRPVRVRPAAALAATTDGWQ
jgi:DNA repair exonuclease SbcCD ATPase subunit